MCVLSGYSIAFDIIPEVLDSEEFGSTLYPLYFVSCQFMRIILGILIKEIIQKTDKLIVNIRK